MNELQFSLKSYRLCKLHFQIADENKPNETVEFSFEVSCSYTIKEEQAVVFLSVRTVGNNLPFTIETAFQGICEFNQNLNSVESVNRDKSIKIHCASVLFPFLREVVAETTRKAGFAPLILPPTNFVALYSQIKENEKNEPQLALPSVQ